MRVLIFHGYLLEGTGSNVYNAQLTRALIEQDIEVDLICQDRRPEEFGWVSEVGTWDSGALEIVRGKGRPGGASVFRPNIGSLLPVYVKDEYEGLEAKEFHDLSDTELDRYIETNVAAIADVIERHRPDLALANHLVMGPAILARALAGQSIPYVVKIHGSALEFTVKPNKDRFLAFAQEGLDAARAILVGSRHTAESLWKTMDDLAVEGKTYLGPPGVDLENFAPRSRSRAIAGFESLRGKLAAFAQAKPSCDEPVTTFSRDLGKISKNLEAVDPRHDRIVIFVGKLIASKGLELLLAAWPMVYRKVPNARLLIVGFGSLQHSLVELWRAICNGTEAQWIDENRDWDHPFLDEFFGDLDDRALANYTEQAAAAEDYLTFVGRLNHPELCDLLPLAEALVVPSTFPEAFGMVAAEGAAVGAFPIVADHSGLGEVAAGLREELDAQAGAWLSFSLEHRPVEALANNVASWLTADEAIRTTGREAVAKAVHFRYGWSEVARILLVAGQGDLTGLRRP